jgi:hypothetical protein
MNIDVQVLAIIDDGVDKWTKSLRDNPSTTAEIADKLHGAMSEELSALMLATALQRLAAT